MNQRVIVAPGVFPSLWVVYLPHEPVFVLKVQLRVLVHLFGRCGPAFLVRRFQKIVNFVKPLRVLGVNLGIASFVNIFPVNSHGNLIQPLPQKSRAILEVLSLESFDIDQTQNGE
jgi:hypothetical protein